MSALNKALLSSIATIADIPGNACVAERLWDLATTHNRTYDPAHDAGNLHKAAQGDYKHASKP